MRDELLIFSMRAVMASNADKRAHREVQESRGDDGVQNKTAVKRSGLPTGAELPEIFCKEKREDAEKQSSHFQPQHAGGMRKGLPDGVAEAA